MTTDYNLDLAGLLAASFSVTLTSAEMLQVIEMLGREPSRTEAYIFDVSWSEHCSYKSSRWVLSRYLPTRASNVVLGPGEDAGIVRLFTDENGVNKCLVVAHESHNHPSQVLPEEGAATGVGGIVRDVYCMGADVVGVLDPLRFGDPTGKNAARSKAITRGVVDGIWRYGNAIGVPNIGGDIVFDECYDDNCLVNVVALGIVDEDKIIRSKVPGEAMGEHYLLLLVGKPTDDTGVGGASFASTTLEQSEDAANKSAVQVPDPFLKRVLTEANKELLKRANEKNIAIGMKDLGAGGLSGASSELVSSSALGVFIDLDKVPLAIENLPPEVIAVAETQERYIIALPSHFSEEALKIYNEEFDLPRVFAGAGAAVIGEFSFEPFYRMLYRGELVADLPVDVMITGVHYDRPTLPMTPPSSSELEYNGDLTADLIRLLGSPNICSRHKVVDHYDKHVQGHTVIQSGEADAGVIAPWHDSRYAIAATVDGNPYIGRLDPYAGGAHAVLEVVRNLACVGAEPVCITDCLNFGNPEIPEVMWQFTEAVRGLGDACRGIGLPSSPGDPLPVISGNVSLYNESDTGAAVHPSPIVAGFGFLGDFANATTMAIKERGNVLYLLGRRWGEMGASQLYRLYDNWGTMAPRPRFSDERNMMHTVLMLNNAQFVASAHDVSDGGLATSLAEMIIATEPNSKLGIEIDVSTIRKTSADLDIHRILFSENGGYIIEVKRDIVEQAEKIMSGHKIDYYKIGEVTGKDRLEILDRSVMCIELGATDLRRTWEGGLDNVL